jgi:DNA-binding MarR family transcriptional regulator
VEELPGLSASSGYLLARLGGESRRRWARMLAAEDLTPHHFGVLSALAAAGSAHQQRLAEIIGVDRRNAVAVLSALERRGLVERHSDPGNRRRYIVDLTEPGRAALDRVRGQADELEREMLASLTERERGALHRLLEKLFTATVFPG